MTDRRPTLLILLVILSLVFHGCLLIVFLFMERPQHTSPSISFEPFDDENNNQNQLSSGIAALKPRASSFGASVSLHNQPPPFLEQSNDPHPGNDQLDQSTHDTQDSEDQKNQTLKNNDSKKQETLSANESAVQAPQSFETPTPDKNSSQTNAKSPDTNLPRLRKRRKKKRRSSAGQPTTHGSGMQTRQLTFADIAQGFIESLKHEGDDWLKRDGDPNKRPDEGELRYLSYIQKVVWYLQNSFRQTEPKQWPSNSASVSFKITLNKEGEIHDLRCLQSCGNEKIDSFLQKRITQAGPFPPLPDHFKRNDFQILLSFTVGSQRMPQINGYIATIPPR